jgi:hypothetical protein
MDCLSTSQPVKNEFHVMVLADLHLYILIVFFNLLIYFIYLLMPWYAHQKVDYISRD